MFLAARCMRFYGMSRPQLMQLPIGTFWALNDCIGRISAEEDQRHFMNSANAAAPPEQRSDYYNSLTSRVGKVYVIDQGAYAEATADRDEKGFDELRMMTE